MKRKLALLLVTMMTCVSVAACGSSTENAEDAGTEETSTEETSTESDGSEEETVTVDTSELDGIMDLTIDDASYLDGINLSDYVTLGDYIGLSKGMEEPQIEDEVVNYYINYYYMSDVENTPITDRTDVQNGDTANIDYEGKYADSGEAFEGGTAEGYDLTIGSGTFIDGFEEGLIGVEVGDTVDLNLTFPEDYGNEDLAGVDVIFTVTVNSISEAPELTDELVEGFAVDGVSTVEELQAYVRDQMYEYATSSVDSNVLQALVDASEVKDVPETMVNAYMRLLHSSIVTTVDSYVAAGYELTVADYYSNIMTSYAYEGDSAYEFVKEQATQQVKYVLVLAAVGEAEGMSITSSEKQSQIDDILTNSSYESINAYSEATGLDIEKFAEQDALTEKVLDFLVDNAVFNKPEAEEAETDSTEADNAETEDTADAEASK